MDADIARMHALIRHLAEFGRLTLWIVLITFAVLCLAVVVAYNRIMALASRKPHHAHTGEQPAA